MKKGAGGIKDSRLDSGVVAAGLENCKSDEAGHPHALLSASPFRVRWRYRREQEKILIRPASQLQYFQDIIYQVSTYISLNFRRRHIQRRFHVMHY